MTEGAVALTAADPERRPSGEARAERRDSMQPDPWGVRRAENLITSLQGVLSARVVVSPIGEVTEIHVLTQGGTSAKQVVRNVESALLAHLGLKIDHRKISVAQTAEVRPIEALERSVVKEEALRRGIVFTGMDIVTARSHRVQVEVTLHVAGEEVTGKDEGADTPKARLQAVARAVVAALDQVLPKGTLALEGVKRVDAFDSEFVFAGVHVVESRGSRLLLGTCQVQDSVEQASILAVLDATNRWMEHRR